MSRHHHPNTYIYLPPHTPSSFTRHPCQCITGGGGCLELLPSPPVHPTKAALPSAPSPFAPHAPQRKLAPADSWSSSSTSGPRQVWLRGRRVSEEEVASPSSCALSVPSPPSRLHSAQCDTPRTHAGTKEPQAGEARGSRLGTPRPAANRRCPKTPLKPPLPFSCFHLLFLPLFHPRPWLERGGKAEGDCRAPIELRPCRSRTPPESHVSFSPGSAFPFSW